MTPAQSGDDSIKKILEMLASSCLRMEAEIGGLRQQVRTLEKVQDELRADVRALRDDVASRMSPDRCAHLHDTLVREMEDKAEVIANVAVKRAVSSITRQASLAWRIIRAVIWLVAALATGLGGGTLALRVLGAETPAQVLAVDRPSVPGK